MTISNIGILVSIIAATCTAVIFVGNKIMNRVKHEQAQDEKIDQIIDTISLHTKNKDKSIAEITDRITLLEHKDRATEMTLVSIKERMEILTQSHETTQTMIQRLEDHQQQTFTQLIDTLKEIKIG